MQNQYQQHKLPQILWDLRQASSSPKNWLDSFTLMYYITALLADMYYKGIEENFAWGMKGKACIPMIFHLCGHRPKYITGSKEPHSKPLKHRYIWPFFYDRIHKQVRKVLIVEYKFTF